MHSTPRLTFVSPRFLFPTDSGGKIRTTQILRGLKGGAFQVTLLMPATDQLRDEYAADIESVCDRALYWDPPTHSGLIAKALKTVRLASQFPVSVASDRNTSGMRCVRRALAEEPDVVVFDFPHSAILAPAKITVPSVLFTHNIEAEIFRRHCDVATSHISKAVWKNQYRKMCRYEQRVLSDFDTVIAVSDRDRSFFQDEWNIEHCHSIPTGVDTEFFSYKQPQELPEVVFCGSMDWMANIDAVEFFHDSVWPLIRAEVPEARMKVVGRSPPNSLTRRILSSSPDWQFTGFVDDVRDHVAGAAAFVIPLRVGGGTRIKAFEAMAMGTPVVSTTIGVEGLPLVDGAHYLNADQPAELASKVISLLRDHDFSKQISRAARQTVEQNFGYQRAAEMFEKICIGTAEQNSRARSGMPG